MNVTNIKLSEENHKCKNSYCDFIYTKLKLKNPKVIYGLRSQDGGYP